MLLQVALFRSFFFFFLIEAQEGIEELSHIEGQEGQR